MKKKNKENKIILGTTVGTIGSALGISLKNISIGISTEVVIGTAIGLTMINNKGK